jgi:DNA primase
VTELTPLIAELDDEIERQHYLQKLSRLVQVDEATIAGRIHAAAKTGQVAVRSRSGRETGQGGNRVAPRSTTRQSRATPTVPGIEPDTVRAGLEREDYLLANLLREPDIIVWFSEACAQKGVEPPQTSDWQYVENQEIFRALRQYISTDEPWDPDGFQDMLTPHLHGRLAQLVAESAQFPQCTPTELRDDMLKVLVRLRIDRLKDENRRITFLIDEAQRSGDREAAREFTATNNRTLRDLSHLDSTFADLSRVLVAQSRPEQGIKIR